VATAYLNKIKFLSHPDNLTVMREVDRNRRLGHEAG
jgi:hypothetical protein